MAHLISYPTQKHIKKENIYYKTSIFVIQMDIYNKKYYNSDVYEHIIMIIRVPYQRMWAFMYSPSVQLWMAEHDTVSTHT
jgi:hypothetical protein